jgi:hypothetical protein
MKKTISENKVLIYRDLKQPTNEEILNLRSATIEIVEKNTSYESDEMSDSFTDVSIVKVKNCTFGRTVCSCCGRLIDIRRNEDSKLWSLVSKTSDSYIYTIFYTLLKIWLLFLAGVLFAMIIWH